jgi:hypothetical protein
LIKTESAKDEICRNLICYCGDGWPEKSKLDEKLPPYFTESTVHDNLLFKGTRIVIPHSLQNEILNRVPDGHQGIVKCRERARSSVWWLGLSSQLEDVVKIARNVSKIRMITLNHSYLLNFRSDRGKKLPRICSR